MKNSSLSVILIGVIAVFTLSFTASSQAQKRPFRRAQVCGDPAMKCGEFQPFDLQFRWPRNAVIFETEPFYAIILQSINAKADCEAHISEDVRLEAQRLFPHNKVFADRCPDAGSIYYSKTNADYRFMAVYAGKTRAEADRLLAIVRATGKYPTANLRRMQAGFNGT
ncbi:MAG TPA: hypothetical protein VGN95_00260 [Pyrinomonadaceae bacterium]|nr:hypothetical protein [Pyrinomonadaceae bacterium]